MLVLEDSDWHTFVFVLSSIALLPLKPAYLLLRFDEFSL
jgi:hypothetical protein